MTDPAKPPGSAEAAAPLPTAETLVGHAAGERRTTMPSMAPPPPPAIAETVAATASQETQATQAALTPRPSSDVRPRSSTTGSSGSGSGSSGTGKSVGEEMKSASIERFGEVGRGRFEILDELARGGLGRVFRARDPRTGRIVAVKEVLRPNADLVQRFAREALVTANLQHPSIVPVYEVGRWPSGEPFYAMKLVVGRTLEDLIEEASTTDARIGLLPHVIDVADALAYAHSEHVIHRDLKPANILVGAYGETVVIDWGLAKNLATGEESEPVPFASTIPPDTGETMAGAVLGTPAYMPPEQALGDTLDAHADVYAIGAILYHTIGGVRPYLEARTLDDLLEAVATRPPVPLDTLAPDAPPELVAIVDKAMARRAENRYPTAKELARDLRRFQAGKLVGAHRYTTWQLIRRWVASHRAVVLTAATALSVLIGTVTVGVWRITKERDTATRQREIAQHERGEAQSARALAEQRFADSLEELGRQALLAGAPDRAAPLLAGAGIARSGSTPTLGVLGAQARAGYGGLVGIAPAQAKGTTSTALVHDGNWLVSASADGTVRAWDLVANREVWSGTQARLIAGSPDGAQILGVDAPDVVTVRSATDGKERRRWKLPPSPAEDVPSLLRWSPDGTRFALASPGGRVLLGAIDPPQLIAVEGHASEIWALAFSPDGKTLASAGNDGATVLHDVPTGKTRAKLVDGAGSEVAGVTWISSTVLVTGDQKGVARLWDVERRAVTRRFQHPADIYGVAVGGAGRWLATFGHGAVVMVWDLASGAELAKLEGHTFGTDVAAVVGELLVTTDEVGNAFVWMPATGERLQALPNEGGNIDVTATKDRVVVFGAGRQRVWEISADRIARRIPGHTARVRDLVFSSNTVLWTASHDGSARRIDLDTGTEIRLGDASFSEPDLAAAPVGGRPPTNPRGMRSVQMSPDGTLAVTMSEDGSVLVFDAKTGAPRASWKGHTGRALRVVFTRDGKQAFTAGDTTVRRWDVATGTELGRTDLGGLAWDLALIDEDRVVVTQADPPHTDPSSEPPPPVVGMWRASDLAPIKTAVGIDRLRQLYPIGDRVVVGDHDTLTVLGSDGTIAAQTTHTRSVTVAIAAERGWVAVGGSLGDIALRTWPSLELVRTWSAKELVIQMKFRPDGHILAAASARRVSLWDPATARLLGELELPFLVFQLAWSPDGNRLAIAGASGTVWLWNLRPEDPESLGAFARCASPWRLDDTVLSVATFDPASCSVLSAPP